MIDCEDNWHVHLCPQECFNYRWSVVVPMTFVEGYQIIYQVYRVSVLILVSVKGSDEKQNC